MADADTGVLSGDLGDALSGSPLGSGTLYLTPPRWVGYESGFVASPSPIAIPVSLSGVITPTKIARTDTSQPAYWAYRAYADVPGLSQEPFRLIMAGDAMTIAEAIVPDEPGVPTWAPADLSAYPSRDEVLQAIRDQAGAAQQLRITGNTLSLEPGGNTVTLPTVTASGEPVLGPQGPAPVITWQGTKIVVDGKPGPDLRGMVGKTGPQGPAPVITWQGTKIVVDGKPGPDLRGMAFEPQEKEYSPQLWGPVRFNIGDGTLTGGYTLVGKLCFFWISLVRGASTNVGGAAYEFTLPVRPRRLREVSGVGWTSRGDTACTVHGISPEQNDRGPTVGLIISSTGKRVDQNNPAGWATGDQIYLSGHYVAA
ncbi:hypothetical protein [uncultured Tessaracoccus sp.]|uniref:hypothetical protein n=1 Tax=uncultured Tessaracoccus sp. TaxID=905023 RepID=UPI002630A338|nr:hypothetical protein [uncultured Tessaracoccus sp.]